MFKYSENFTGLYTKQSIEILIATMHRDNFDFLKSMFPHENLDELQLLIINQTDTKELVSTKPNIRVINSQERGLSKSRNMALQNAKGELCVITDDDVIFLPDFLDIIAKGYNQFPNASMLRFRAEKDDGILLKKYPKRPKEKLSWLDIMNVVSFEITIKRADILKENITFNEHFGLGSTFTMGEEQIFLSSIKKANLQLSYIPKTIVRHDHPSTHQKVSFETNYFVQGAMNDALFRGKTNFWILLKILFDVKQGNLKSTQITKALNAAKKGRQTYRNLRQ